MAEEVTEAKLVEANAQFMKRNFEETLKILSSCPPDDIKVKHNVAIVQYMQKGGNVKDVLAVLESVPADLVAPITEKGAKAVPETVGASLLEDFVYDGHEGAHYNRAVVLLHNGFVEKSISILRELATREPPVSPEIQVRSALLLQVATPALNKKKTRTRADEDLISKVFEQNIKLIQANTSLKRMFQLAFCDNSNLHDWYRDSSKSASDRVTYYNNLGTLAMNEGKENLAAIYFSNALKNINENDTNSELVLHSVLYNAGVCALLRKEYNAAVKSLLLTQESMKGSPILWLRVAQAALGVHSGFATTSVAEAYAESQNAIAETLAKSGRILPGFQLLQVPSTLGVYGSNTDPASRTALDTAMKAIDNGLSLLVPTGSSLTVAADKLVLTGNTSLFRALQYLLCYAAYVELQRLNYAAAALIATDLLSLGKGGHPLSPDVLVTAVIYASEALCNLNKPASALKILQSVSAADFIVMDNIVDQKLRVSAVMINLVVVHIANGNWKAASTLTTNLISKYNATPAATVTASPTFTANTPNNYAPNNSTPAQSIAAGQAGGSPWMHIGRCATLLQIFIELAQGNRDRALEILALQPVAPPLS
eukprot:GILI01006143.1.p1 GENE.GILI01006143.1~~GILI01006143.1.p1  ORF type:complete len:598 (+),score=130.90 GILI01006143.1:127-1920(+)